MIDAPGTALIRLEEAVRVPSPTPAPQAPARDGEARGLGSRDPHAVYVASAVPA